MDELINEKKCFYSNFSQNLYNNYNLTFYYCNKSIKNILYEKIPYIKFASNELNYIFELTKEELFYEKGDYIYFMILFCEFESNTYWITGQIFTSKYNFVFDANKKQIGFYKNSKNKEDKNDNKKEKRSKNKRNNILIIIIIGLCIILFFTFIWLFLGKKIYGHRRKIIANELTDEIDYNYKINEDNNIKTNKDEENYNISGNNKDNLNINN